MNTPIDFEVVRLAFRDGSINAATDEELQRAIGSLANTRIMNDSVQHEAIVMADAIHSILLRRLLDTQEERNQKSQRWFMILAIAGVIAAIVQVVMAIIKK